MSYNPQKIEKKWQKKWENSHKAEDFSEKPKEYLLVEFPYPSGDGLHVGHCRSFAAMDVLARKKRMEGKNVLFPMGWDAFGLPTENYAIKKGIHPREATKKNTENFKKQEKSLGLSFNWEREVNTTDPKYYKWTQWIFLKLWENGLAYKYKMPINWCPSCKIGLANEEVVSGCCERCGEKVEQKDKEQWMLKITKYADRLINDLKKVDFPEKVKALQKDWIGRSEGVEFEMPVEGEKIKVFTTRIDTVFGMTYVVVSSDHPLSSKIAQEKKEVEKYIKEVKDRPESERVSTEKTGVFTGKYALNVFSNEKVPVYISDYVLMSYGTGAVMAVPAHDQRDYEFAKKYDLPVKEVVKPEKGESDIEKGAFLDDGILINSNGFSGLKSKEAREKMAEWLKKEEKGEKKVHYKLRDWVFSRQHYWGEPIPMIKCKECGWVPVPEKELPVELPDVKKYQPTDTGESPLSDMKKWVRVDCPKCGESAKRETDTMPNWAGSNWYYLRYCDPQNEKDLASKELLKYWMPVDWYNGGMEHTTLHLLYSRFIYKFLWDIGVIPEEVGPEPYKKRTSQGMVLGEGGIKMSKSKGNVINPDEIVEQKGADILRIYEMFMGPFDQAIAWDSSGVNGSKRFLDKIFKLTESFLENGSGETRRMIHKTVKKVSEDIDSMKFNTAVSSLMKFVNVWQKEKTIEKRTLEDFLKILSPFAPHLSEELWERLGNKESIFLERWPSFDPKMIKEKKTILIIQINGKVRDQMEIERGLSEEEVKEMALQREKVKKWLEKGEIKKTVFVPDKIINFVK